LKEHLAVSHDERVTSASQMQPDPLYQGGEAWMNGLIGSEPRVDDEAWTDNELLTDDNVWI
jgi:hypothetical protein